MRVIGTFDLGATVVALQAPGFLHEHDKKHHLMSRLLVSMKINCVFSLLQHINFNYLSCVKKKVNVSSIRTLGVPSGTSTAEISTRIHSRCYVTFVDASNFVLPLFKRNLTTSPLLAFQ